METQEIHKLADLQRAVQAIEGQCDGAFEVDGVGFNKFDADFGQNMAVLPVHKWSYKQAMAVYRMLHHYRNQLAGLGINYDSLPKPSGEEVFGVKSPRHNRVDYNSATNVFHVYFDYSSRAVEEIKQISGARFQVEPVKHWVVPANNQTVDMVMKFAVIHSLVLSDEAKNTTGLAFNSGVNPKKIRIQDRMFVIEFPYTPNLVAAVKTVKGVRFFSNPPRWTLGAYHGAVQDVANFAKTYDFVLDSEVEQFIQQSTEKIQIQTQASLAKEVSTQDREVLNGFIGTLRPFQEAGVLYALNNKKCLIADEPGCGKTLQALATIELAKAYPALIVVPASLKLNWAKEVEKWLPGDRSYQVIHGKTEIESGRDIYIINYDLLKKHFSNIMGYKYGDFDEARFNQRVLPLKAVVLDESHYIKAHDSLRNQLTQEIVHGVDRVLALTGTPILNRPKELISQLSALDKLNEFGGFWDFAKKFCSAYKGRFGWDLNGADHLEELNNMLRAICMVRRAKKDVLSELPPKQRVLIPIEIDNRREYEDAEEDVVSWLSAKAAEDVEYELSLTDVNVSDEEIKAIKKQRASDKAYRARQAEQLVKIVTLKQIAARGKLETICSWIDDFLETGEKLVVFAHHQEIQKVLLQRYSDALSILGEQNVESRQAAVDEFQDNPEKKLIVCSLMAAGVGITLTAASNVLFTEFGWNPAVMEQASDRCIAEGQLVNTEDRGLVPIENVIVGNRVLTHLGNWKPVTAVSSRQCRGLMTELKYKRFSEPLKSTYDHKILIRRKGQQDAQWIKACEVFPGDFLLMPRPKGTQAIEEFIFPEKYRQPIVFKNSWGKMQRNGNLTPMPQKVLFTDEFLYICGYYLAEGFASIKKGRGAFVSFSGNQGGKYPILEKIKQYFEANYPFTSSIYERNDSLSAELRVFSQELANWFYDWFGHGAYNKKVSQLLLNLSSDQLIHLLNGYVDGDGYKRKQQVEWVTVSQTLAGQINLIALKCGFSSTLRMVGNEHNGGQWIGGYTVNGNPSNQSLSEFDNNYVYEPICEVKTSYEKYARVYDLTVEDDHSFVVGQASVHNCHRIGQQDSVTEYWMVGVDTIDDDIVELIEAKRKIVMGAVGDEDATVVNNLVQRLLEKRRKV